MYCESKVTSKFLWCIHTDHSHHNCGLYIICDVCLVPRRERNFFSFFHVARVGDYMNEQLIIKNVFLYITMQLLSTLQESQMQLKFKISRYIHAYKFTALTQGEKSYERKGLVTMQQLQMLNANICTCSSLIPWNTSTTALVLTLLLLPSLQSKLSEISEEGSQAERKQEVLELHNEVLQWVNVLC